MRVVVVGSGIAGASAAYHLARRGVEVVVVDDERRGLATAAGAGIGSPWATAGEALFAFSGASASHYRRLVAELAEDTDQPSSYAVGGGLGVRRDERRLRRPRP